MDGFLKKIKQILNEDDFSAFAGCLDDEAYRGLRVNTLKISYEELKSVIGFDLKQTPFCPEGAYIPKDVRGLGNSPLHCAGAFYIQEPSAASAVEMLGVEKGDRVLDLCASPGGKSTQIAAALEGSGLLWSNEIIRSRANVLLSNIERTGVKNAAVSCCRPDALCGRLQGFFDKVLVDAPCSGEGMFRKDRQARLEWTPEHSLSCSQRQLQILNSAKLALKPGGVMVYSTCTFSREENEGVIERFLAENPGFTLEEPGVAFGRRTMDYAVRIFPMDGGEGHFAARLRKTDGEDNYHPLENPEISRSQREEIEGFFKAVLTNDEILRRLKTVNNKIYAIPAAMPEISGAGLLRSGVLLGEIRQNRIEPAHHLFTALKKRDFINTADFDVNSSEILRYLHGEETAVSAGLKGYTAVCVNGITAGFGKASGGRLKNKYPKGLRI